MAPACINVNAVVDAREPDALGRIAETAKAQAMQVWATERASRMDSPGEHDDALDGLCAGVEAVTPVPVLLPPTGSRGGLERASEIAKSGRPRIVRLCPVTHRYPLADWVLSPIPEICERHNLSLLIDLDNDPPRWSEIVTFARSFPRVPMVLLGADLMGQLAAAAALDVAPNLLLQVLLDSPNVADLVDTFGAGRFVYGSEHGDVASPPASAPELAALDETSRDALLAANAELLADGTYAERFL